MAVDKMYDYFLTHHHNVACVKKKGCDSRKRLPTTGGQVSTPVHFWYKVVTE
jgi:hypothetical protein